MVFGRGAGYAWGQHIRKAHLKGKKAWVNCWICWLGYSSCVSLQALVFWKISIIKKDYIGTMPEVLSWVLIIIGLSLPPIIAVLLDHYFKKKKLAAETKKIQLANKITEEITYDQLKKESKHKDVKNKLEIFQRLTKLEEEIKNKENKSASDQKKLESLEMIKKEFKETLVEGENEENKSEKPLLVERKTKKKSKHAKKS